MPDKTTKYRITFQFFIEVYVVFFFHLLFSLNLILDNGLVSYLFSRHFCPFNPFIYGISSIKSKLYMKT